MQAHKTQLRILLAGDDPSALNKDELRVAIAREAGVGLSAVTVRVVAASLLLLFDISVASASAADGLAKTLLDRMPTPESTTAVLQAQGVDGVQAIAAPQAEAFEEIVLAPSPSPPPPPPKPPPPSTTSSAGSGGSSAATDPVASPSPSPALNGTTDGQEESGGEQEGSASDGGNAGAILAGGVVGGVAFLLLIGGGILLALRYHRRRSSKALEVFFEEEKRGLPVRAVDAVPAAPAMASASDTATADADAVVIDESPPPQYSAVIMSANLDASPPPQDSSEAQVAARVATVKGRMALRKKRASN